jgi:8-oxo-dGTP pyrophosphatase MutT (NUDIX family)
MASVALVGLVDRRGRVLLQERDDHAPVDPDRWCLVGGQVEPGESALAAAHRELREETGLAVDQLVPVGSLTLPCDLHGEDDVHCFTAPTTANDADVRCGEGCGKPVIC